jgi:DHA3 family macrolide efflux protein-like MFS transporter
VGSSAAQLHTLRRTSNRAREMSDSPAEEHMRHGIPWQADRWRARFFTIWTGQAFSLFGSQLVQFALVWWLTEKTGSGLVLTMATLAAVLPQVVLGPLVGTLVDRWDRRMTMIVADGVTAAATLVLAVAFALRVERVEYVYLALFARSIGGGFHWPAMRASTTLMVPEAQFNRIAGLNQALYGAMSIVAPAAGAALLALVPLQLILGIDVVTAMLAIGPLLVLQIPALSPPAGTLARTFTRNLAEGFRFVASWRGLLAVAAIAALLNFLMAPAVSLLPLLVARRFHGTATHFAVANMAFGVGVVAGGLALTAWRGFRKRMVTSLVGIVCLGVSTVAVGLTPPALFPVAVAAMALTGVMQSMANGPLGAALQASVPPALQGRVFTLVSAGATAMMPIGLAIAGPLSDLVGANAWFVLGGGASILLGVVGLFSPSILRLEERGADLAAQSADSEAEKLPAA